VSSMFLRILYTWITEKEGGRVLSLLVRQIWRFSCHEIY